MCVDRACAPKAWSCIRFFLAGVVGLAATVGVAAGLLAIIDVPSVVENAPTLSVQHPVPVEVARPPKRTTRRVAKRLIAARPIQVEAPTHTGLKLLPARQPSAIATQIAQGPFSKGSGERWERPLLPQWDRVELKPLAPVRPTLGTQSELVPVVAVAPMYPPEAWNRSINGWVLLRYTVTKRGRVTDLKVLRSEPPGVFNSSALEAARKWRYKPRMVEGRATEVTNVWSKVSFHAAGPPVTVLLP